MCTFFLLGTAVSAVIIDDLTLVFGVISGVSECLIIFILPAIFYLKADKISSLKSKKEGASFMTKLGVWAFGLIGVTYFCLSNYYNFKKIMKY